MNGQNRETPMVSGRFSMIFPYDLQDFCPWQLLWAHSPVSSLCGCAGSQSATGDEDGFFHAPKWGMAWKSMSIPDFSEMGMYMYIYIYIANICQYSRNTNMKISSEYWLRVVLYQFVLVGSTIFVENERVWVQNWVEWNQKGWSLFRSETIHFVFYLWWGIKSRKRNITMVCSFFCSSTTHEWFAIAMFDYRRVCVGLGRGLTWIYHLSQTGGCPESPNCDLCEEMMLNWAKPQDFCVQNL